MSKIILRPNTSDANIFRSINDPQFNEYRLPEKFESSDIILDIGCHIGSFSYTCIEKGAGTVIGFEAWKENYDIATQNLKNISEPKPNTAEVVNFAVWRSDLEEMPILSFQESTNKENTGGGNVLFQDQGIQVETISLDTILESMCDNKEIRLLKLDCEGSEFPILLSCTKLSNVKAICGEYHEMGGGYNPFCGIPEKAQVGDYKQYTIVELTQFLEGQGFSVTSYRHGTTNLGMFFAERK